MFERSIARRMAGEGAYGASQKGQWTGPIAA
jgi:hypothetical protein